MSSEHLLLGVAKEDITPKVGGKLYGYRDGVFSTGIHDRLEAVAFVFRQNGTVACTNGSHGYFPTESEICLGGYEILYFKYSRIQQCKPFADNYLIEETLKNLEDD